MLIADYAHSTAGAPAFISNGDTLRDAAGSLTTNSFRHGDRKNILFADGSLQAMGRAQIPVKINGNDYWYNQLYLSR
ncbi:hypothetical protein SDC9_210688 [bioreactor metagenome]|uniref:Uncharacterized protein n=1 Tax=bioreactor metagenome TaxID=1076179 RepID=A0A645JGX8_9ZZZZ